MLSYLLSWNVVTTLNIMFTVLLSFPNEGLFRLANLKGTITKVFTSIFFMNRLIPCP
jgi:hypothetical protein